MFIYNIFNFKYNIQLKKINETMGIIIEIEDISKQNKQLKR